MNVNKRLKRRFTKRFYASRTFIGDLIFPSNLHVGQIIRAGGFYKPGSLVGTKYEIVAPSIVTHNGGPFIDLGDWTKTNY